MHAHEADITAVLERGTERSSALLKVAPLVQEELRRCNLLSSRPCASRPPTPFEFLNNPGRREIIPLYSQGGGSSERGMTWPRSHSWLVAELGLCASFLLSGHVTKRAPCLQSHRGQA